MRFCAPHTRRLGVFALPLALVAQGASAAPSAQNPGDLAAAIRQAALAIAPPGASISLGPVTGAAYMQRCTTALSVTFSGVAPYEQAAAHCPAPVWTLYVTVTVAQTQLVAVAARPLAPGQAIGPGDITLTRQPIALYAGRQVFYDTAPLIGAEAVMSLPAGAILAAQDIEAPVIVKAGQTVAVDVTSGGVDISINAVADETGRLGDTILLTNPTSGRRFSAQVTASGLVVQLQP
jgi:flagella basal body P-ring formation protein FlgA